RRLCRAQCSYPASDVRRGLGASSSGGHCERGVRCCRCTVRRLTNDGGEGLPKAPKPRGENSMTRTITLWVNGKEHTVEVPVHRLLIDCLRYDLGRTGTKEGGSVGGGGACTV